MTTSHVHDLLALHAGGDLDPTDTVRVEAHLATCPDCLALAQAYAESRAWLAAAPDAPFSGGERRAIREAVMDQVRREARPRVQARIPAWKPLLGVAAALMLLLAGLRAWQPTTSPAPSLAQVSKPQTASHDTPVADASRPAQATSGAATSARTGPTDCPDTAPTMAQERPTRTVQMARLQAPADSASDGPQPLAAPTRIEIQTDNPNIRIIWLAQATPEPTGTPSPKE